MLRGLAAVSVMFYHYAEFLGGVQAFPKAYLAVDLFFILSGFVIAHAYETKILNKSIGVGRFMLLRLIRLYPMYLAALALGVGYLATKAVINPSDPNDLALGPVSTSLVFLPWFGQSGGLFPFNPAAWSLFAELAANLIYVALAPRLSNPILIVIVAAAGVALAAVGFNAGSLDVGMTADTFFGGLARVAFSFSLGLLIWRLTRGKPAIHSRAVLLLLPAVVLIFSAGILLKIGAIYDLVVVFVLFPAMVVIGSRFEPPASADRVIRLGADLSYPIYVMHGPVLMVVAGGLKVALNDISGLGPAVGFGMAAATIISSYVLLKVYDEPVRRVAPRGMIRSRLRRSQ